MVVVVLLLLLLLANVGDIDDDDDDELPLIPWKNGKPLFFPNDKVLLLLRLDLFVEPLFVVVVVVIVFTLFGWILFDAK